MSLIKHNIYYYPTVKNAPQPVSAMKEASVTDLSLVFRGESPESVAYSAEPL